MSGAMLADLAEVVRLMEVETDAESYYERFIRTHYAQIARDAEDAAKFNYLITMLPVGTFNDRDVSDRQSWVDAIDAAMRSANGGDVG